MSAPGCRTPFLALCALLGSTFANVVSADIIIDDYETGPATVTTAAPDQTEYGTQSGLPTGHVAGGVRHEDFTVNQYAFPATIQIGGGVMNWTAGNSAAYWNIIYNGNPGGPGHAGQLNLNLTGYERFELTFTRVERSMSGHIRVQSGFSYPSAYVQVTEPGVYPVDLTSFGSVNWVDIDMIRLEFSTGYKYGGGVHTEMISDFRVVPEPGTLVLLLSGGLGLLAYAWRRRR